MTVFIGWTALLVGFVAGAWWAGGRGDTEDDYRRTMAEDFERHTASHYYSAVERFRQAEGSVDG